MTAQNATTFAIAAIGRTTVGKQVRQLRREGQLPAVVYGHKKETVNITVPAHEFLKMYREAGSSSLVDLTIDGAKAEKVLVHEVQVDAPTNTPLHVDFYLVNMKEKLQTEIELEFVGSAPAIEVEGGSLMTAKSAVNVECLPQDLVSSIEVDISSLITFDDDIRVKDIKVPAGIEILDEEDEMIASVTAPRSEEELEALDEAPEDVNVTEIESETGNEPAPEEGAEATKE